MDAVHGLPRQAKTAPDLRRRQAFGAEGLHLGNPPRKAALLSLG
jgi:hypothetical protein